MKPFFVRGIEKDGLPSKSRVLGDHIQTPVTASSMFPVVKVSFMFRPRASDAYFFTF